MRESGVLRVFPEMQGSQAQLRTMINQVPAMVWSCGPDGSMEFLNQRSLEYTGRRIEQSLGWGWKAQIHADDLDRLVRTWRRLLETGTPGQEEARIRRHDGQYRWFLFRAIPVRDQAGRIIRWYGTNTDIEDRRCAEDERVRLQQELETERDRLRLLLETHQALLANLDLASHEHVSEEQRYLREEIDQSSMFEGIVGKSMELRRVFAQVNKVAPSDSTVLIFGETGTGKELITRAIHKRSNRAARAFIRVNCAAIPQQLIASELFGHEKGAFTGAQQRRLGRFELADGGTIFLDEIGELPMETQIALLRVLQEKEFERLGGTQPISVNVRVLAATNRSLRSAVSAGTFREDLFYRLNVFPIHIPSLRERPDDIPLLVEYFLDRYATRAEKQIRKIEKKTLEFLQAYAWPGNIRELQNVVERAVILCEGETFSVDETWLTLDQPQESRLRSSSFRGLLRLDDKREKELVEAALAESKGRVSGPNGAATKLGIPRQTLESKMISLGINKNAFK